MIAAWALAALLAAGARAQDGLGQLHDVSAGSTKGKKHRKADSAAWEAGKPFTGAGSKTRLTDTPVDVRDEKGDLSTKGSPKNSGGEVDGPAGAPGAGADANVTPYQGELDSLVAKIEAVVAQLRAVAAMPRKELAQQYGQAMSVNALLFALFTGGVLAALVAAIVALRDKTSEKEQVELVKAKGREVVQIAEDLQNDRPVTPADVDRRMKEAGEEWREEAHRKLE